MFWDVSEGYWAGYAIGRCYKAGIVAGNEDGSYDPEAGVSRDQMAVFLARAMAGGDSNVPAPPAQGHFPDVLPGSWAFKYIEYVFAQGVAEGESNGNYQPGDAVDRAQMAVFVARALAGGDSNVPPAEERRRSRTCRPSIGRTSTSSIAMPRE